MKNLLLNKDFMKYTAFMNGWDFKQLVEWLYVYAVSGTIPTDEELNNASDNVCFVIHEYIPYIDYCNSKYDSKKNEADFKNILNEKTEKKKEDDFVGKIGLTTKKKNKKNEEYKDKEYEDNKAFQ